MCASVTRLPAVPDSSMNSFNTVLWVDFSSGMVVISKSSHSSTKAHAASGVRHCGNTRGLVVNLRNPHNTTHGKATASSPFNNWCQRGSTLSWWGDWGSIAYNRMLRSTTIICARQASRESPHLQVLTSRSMPCWCRNLVRREILCAAWIPGEIRGCLRR